MGPKCQNGPKKVPILLSSPKFLILPSDDAEKGKHIEVTDRQSLLCPILTYTMYHVPFLLKIESPCDCGTVHMPIDSRPEPCLQRICRKLSIFIAHFADTVALYCGMGAMYMPQYYPRHPEQIGNHQWSDVWLDPRLASRLLRPAQQARGPLALERAARLSKSAAPVCEVC